MTTPLTARMIVDRASSRHPMFGQAGPPEGAIVAFIDDTQRRLLLKYGGAIDGIVSTSVQIAAAPQGLLVGINPDGTPYQLSSIDDGWAVQVNANGTPYVDTSTTPIAIDPFGASGGTPGFPLPGDFVKLVAATAVGTTGLVRPIDVIAERARLSHPRPGMLSAFIAGNRLVPIRPLATGNAGDVWDSSVSAVQLSYVARPVLASLDDPLMLPSVLVDALTAAVASLLAQSAPALSETQRSRFEGLAEKAEESLEIIGTDITGDVAVSRVRYRR